MPSHRSSLEVQYLEGSIHAQGNRPAGRATRPGHEPRPAWIDPPCPKNPPNSPKRAPRFTAFLGQRFASGCRYPFRSTWAPATLGGRAGDHRSDSPDVCSPDRAHREGRRTARCPAACSSAPGSARSPRSCRRGRCHVQPVLPPEAIGRIAFSVALLSIDRYVASRYRVRGDPVRPAVGDHLADRAPRQDLLRLPLSQAPNDSRAGRDRSARAVISRASSQDPSRPRARRRRAGQSRRSPRASVRDHCCDSRGVSAGHEPSNRLPPGHGDATRCSRHSRRIGDSPMCSSSGIARVRRHPRWACNHRRRTGCHDRRSKPRCGRSSSPCPCDPGPSRRVVGADHLRGQDPPGHLPNDRLEQFGDGGHPVAHRRAGQLDAVPPEDPFEPVERK